MCDFHFFWEMSAFKHRKPDLVDLWKLPTFLPPFVIYGEIFSFSSSQTIGVHNVCWLLVGEESKPRDRPNVCSQLLMIGLQVNCALSGKCSGDQALLCSEMTRPSHGWFSLSRVTSFASHQDFLLWYTFPSL